jgi:hypothetical protein
MAGNNFGELDKCPIDKNLGEQAKCPIDKKMGELDKRPINKNLQVMRITWAKDSPVPHSHRSIDDAPLHQMNVNHI